MSVLTPIAMRRCNISCAPTVPLATEPRRYSLRPAVCVAVIQRS